MPVNNLKNDNPQKIEIHSDLTQKKTYPEKFKNKYRISSSRKENWDYSWTASYFITICTQDKKHYFGDIKNGEMILSEIGKLAHSFWQEIPLHTKYVTLDAFIVMPNHIHGILNINDALPGIITRSQQEIEDSKYAKDNYSLKNKNELTTNPIAGDTQLQALLAKSLQMGKISPIPNSISTIIRSFKSAVTRHANLQEIPFKWQTRFHDHIIRDITSYINIQNYIINNPKKWSNPRKQ